MKNVFIPNNNMLPHRQYYTCLIHKTAFGFAEHNTYTTACLVVVGFDHLNLYNNIYCSNVYNTPGLVYTMAGTGGFRAVLKRPHAMSYWILRILTSPAKKRRWSNGFLMLSQRHRRWPNIKTTLVQRLVFAGTCLFNNQSIQCTRHVASRRSTF